LSPTSTSVAAQTLVQDTKGKVEAINIRTIRLRDDNGSVHTIPYSSVTTITNMSRDFSRWMIEAAVAYRADVDRVLETLKEVGEGLRRHPEFGPAAATPASLSTDRISLHNMRPRRYDKRGFATAKRNRWRSSLNSEGGAGHATL
jgi:small-conductance mechanosensitive channel